MLKLLKKLFTRKEDQVVVRLNQLFSLVDRRTFGIRSVVNELSNQLQEIRRIMQNQQQILEEILSAISDAAANVSEQVGKVSGDVKTLGADMTKALTDLEAKIAAGAQTQDLQPMIDKAKAVAASFASISEKLTALDSAATDLDSAAKAADPNAVASGAGAAGSTTQPLSEAQSTQEQPTGEVGGDPTTSAQPAEQQIGNDQAAGDGTQTSGL